jgi:hypothetical protein
MRWGCRRAGAALCLVLFLCPQDTAAQNRPLAILDVPFMIQSEELCGGAAAAMVLRYWGERGLSAEDFTFLLDSRANAIRGDVLAAELRRRGWIAQAFRGDDRAVKQHLDRGRPLIALIEDRPGRLHYVVLLAWAEGQIVLHDPARGAFRVVAEATFLSAWAATDSWTLLVLPDTEVVGPPALRQGTARTHEAAAIVPSNDGCDALVSQGVGLAHGGDRAAADVALSTALERCPASSKAARELAGLRFVQSRWNDAAQLAARAVAHAPDDSDAWRLLAASRFILEDPDAALQAWNRIGEPQIDLVRVEGLNRTNQTVVHDLLDLPPHAALTTASLQRARRRLALLPAASATRVDYRPVPGGLVEVEAAVIERPRFPGRVGLVAAGAHALIERELLFGAAVPAGGGARLNLGWRWWAERPRLAVSLGAPAAFGRSGLWQLDGFWERQSYDIGGSANDSIVQEDRKRIALSYSDWVGANTRLGLAAALDRWDSSGIHMAISGRAEHRLADDRLAVRARTGIWPALGRAESFAAGGLDLFWRSTWTSEARLTARAGLESASIAAPLDLWPGADVGHARDVLARAHPLLHGGVVSGGIFGRTIGHGGVEGQAKIFTRGPAKLALALFTDIARAWHPLEPTSAGRTQIDVGIGLRVRVAGGARTLRIDVAHGLRDGQNAISAGWQLPWPHER